MAVSIKTIFPRKRFKPITSQGERNERRFFLPKLPEAYKKFYSEWKDHEDEATIIHWVPRNEHWTRNPETGEVKRVENRPIPVQYPDQTHVGIWGGCGVVQGLVKKGKYKRPVPLFWVPELEKTVVYSEILDKYLSVVVTKRALELIDENYGLDAYLLKNPAYELKSLLALKIKRKILEALAKKDFAHDDVEKQTKLYEKYKQYIIPPEELEWYGLSAEEALHKVEAEERKAKMEAIVPLKFQFRKDLIQKLKDEQSKPTAESGVEASKVTSWMSKLNPFAKPADVPDESAMKRTN